MKVNKKELLKTLGVSGVVGSLAGLMYIAMHCSQMHMVGINVPALDLMKGFGQSLLTVGAMTAGARVLSNRLDRSV